MLAIDGGQMDLLLLESRLNPQKSVRCDLTAVGRVSEAIQMLARHEYEMVLTGSRPPQTARGLRLHGV